MFLLVSGCHVGAHTDGHQYGVSIQISINLGKKFLRISRIRKIAVTRILARVFAYLPSFISQILDFIYWRFWFLFWSILNCVTLKTSNRSRATMIPWGHTSQKELLYLPTQIHFPIAGERVTCRWSKFTNSLGKQQLDLSTLTWSSRALWIRASSKRFFALFFLVLSWEGNSELCFPSTSNAQYSPMFISIPLEHSPYFYTE